MIRFTMLGGIGLLDREGADIDQLLRQPKRLALLAYLAAPAPGAWHRRDSLLPLFWPEFDDGRARTALRNALYVLRQTLGDDAVRTRGDDDVSLDPSVIETDLGALAAALESGRAQDVVELYRGELLPGLFVTGSEGFERWLEEERAHLRARVAKAAGDWSEAMERDGRLDAAILAAERAAALRPDDEVAVRRLMRLFDAAGDRGRALAVFERFRTWLDAELGAEPAAETIALASQLRVRTPAPPAPPESPTGRHDATQPGAAAAAADRATVDAAPEHLVAPASLPAPRAHARHRRVAGVAVGLVVAFAAIGAWLHRAAQPSPAQHRTLLVLPMTNHTGDRGNDYLAAGIAEDLARGLRRAPALRVLSAARSQWRPGLTENPVSLGRRLRASDVLETSLERAGDSLAVQATLIAVGSADRRRVTSRTLTDADLQTRESELTAAVLGALFRAPVPQFARPGIRAVDPESYRLTLEGLNVLIDGQGARSAAQLFLAAVSKDPGNARAWAGLSSAWTAMAQTGLADPDPALARAEAAARRALAIDSTDGTAWANLGQIRIIRDGDLRGGRQLIAHAEEVDPGNPEIYLVESVSLRQTRHYDEARAAIRVARELDPFTMRYAEREGLLYLCEGRTREALAVYRDALAVDSTNGVIRSELVGTLARMGRWDEAIRTWARFATAPSDSAVARVLASARGREGYWAARHEEGKAILARRLAQAESGWSSPVIVAYAYIAAGKADSGMAILEREAGTRSPPIYNLPCNPLLDEVRGSPRFAALMARAARLDAR